MGAPTNHRTALTTSARAAINQAVKSTRRRDRDAEGPSQLLLALLAQDRPDPVAELRVDRPAVRTRLG
ncbi:hypothetical protein AB0B45_41310 [Nonomuraea sp. NPDC049152]|uniref:hypothetical protein n=1 Tax=Nonomuraea sp. NPDC049152 TaxID=3154350 RepID=UPI0033C64532